MKIATYYKMETMKDINEADKNVSDKSREHLANERTFLAWVRTSIALMGFGFVIVKFALFLKHAAILMNSKELASKATSSPVGVVMIVLGILIALLAFLQYKKHEKQLKNDSYYPSSTLILFVTLILIIGGSILAIYLIPIL